MNMAWRNRMLTVLCGALLALGHAPFSLPYLVMLGLPILTIPVLSAHGVWGGFKTGWLAGFVYFAGSMFWIMEPFFVEPEIYGWMAPFGLLFLAGGLALFWGVAFGAASFLSGRLRLLALVAIWTLAEFGRANLFTGFPWGLLAYVWSETSVFFVLSWVGPHGLGMLTVAIGVLPMMASRTLGRSVAIVVGIAGLWGAGYSIRPTEPIKLQEVTVRLVQPNAAQNLKWHPDHVSQIFERGLSLSAGDGAAVDLVIWPETSIPFVYGTHAQGSTLLKNAMSGAQFIGGEQRYQGDLLYNTLIHLSEDGEILATYDKHHLVPFGEYVPFADYLARFGFHGMAAHDGFGFMEGDGPQIISVDGIPPYLPLICYEAIFPGLAQVPGQRPDWLVHITNDAWFGNFSGPYQHLVQARARAIEQGLPVARVANTGISAMIDPYGRITKMLPLNTAGFLDVRIPEPAAPTIYSNFGEWIWIVLAGLCVLIVSIGRISIRSGEK